MQRAVVYSVVFHLLLVVLGTVGLPFLDREVEVVEAPIIVDLVQVAERTAAPPPAPRPKENQEPKPEPKKEEPKPEPPPAPKPEPPKPEPPKPEPPKAEPPPPPKPPEPPKPETPPPPPEPKKEEPKPEPPKKPDPPKKEEPKKEPPKKEEPKRDAFDDLLKNVEKMRDKATPPPPAPSRAPAPAPSQQTAQAGPRIFNAPVAAQATMSEIDAMRKQVEDKWVYDAGARGVGSMTVSLRLTMLPDGTVTNVRIVDMVRYGTDGVYRALADSAVRAVYKASPLRYPAGKYETFKDIEMNFRPPAGM